MFHLSGCSYIRCRLCSIHIQQSQLKLAIAKGLHNRRILSILISQIVICRKLKLFDMVIRRKPTNGYLTLTSSFVCQHVFNTIIHSTITLANLISIFIPPYNFLMYSSSTQSSTSINDRYSPVVFSISKFDAFPKSSISVTKIRIH